MTDPSLIDLPLPAIRCIAAGHAGPVPDFTFDAYRPGSACEVLLPAQGEARARALLDLGAPRVFVGDAALRESTLIERLARDYGTERIGLYVPVKRMQVSWALETASNADFKVVAPSVGAPAWEILAADGRRTGTLVGWWMAALFERGASAALVRVDIADDMDLALCAELHEQFRARMWIGPLEAQDCDFIEWVRWGHAMQLAVPQTVLETNASLAVLRQGAESTKAEPL